MFAKLLEAMFGIGDGTSWLDLDDRMRGQLRFWGIMAVLVLLALIVSSLYVYVEWTPLKGWIDSLWGDVQKSMKSTGDIPKWVLWTGGVWFGGVTLLSLVFFYFLIDFGKMHYKIDAVTFRAIPRVGEYVQFALLKNLQCADDPGCSLRQAGTRRLMKDVFYYFANRDEVGGFSQKDKRRQVFAHWTKYYVFNFVMVITSLAWLWLCFLMFIRASLWVSLGLVAFIIPMVLFWHWRGTRYRSSLLELAGDQIRAFCEEIPAELKTQAKKLVKSCSVVQCPFSNIVIDFDDKAAK